MASGNMERISESTEKAQVEEVDSSDSSAEESDIHLMPIKHKPISLQSHHFPQAAPNITYQTAPPSANLVTDDRRVYSDLPLASAATVFRDRATSGTFDRRVVPSAPTSRRMTMRRDSDDQHEMTRAASMRTQLMGQRLMMMLQRYGSRNSIQSSHELKPPVTLEEGKKKSHGFDGISTTLSAMYAKIIVIMGIVLPVTDVVSTKAQPSFFQGYYLYLYLVSMAYVGFMYISQLRFTAIATIVDKFGEDSEAGKLEKKGKHHGNQHHASFYLRVGAIAFGIGSMVYSGLELGQYFELKEDDNCQNLLVAITPAARIVLCIVQMQLIFIGNSSLPMMEHKIISKFGLMHLMATNLNEWLYVIIEEAKHEMHHIAHHQALNESGIHEMHRRATATEIVIECRRSNIMGNLVQTAAPFLFPCTIEYSLICAVILFEMWHHICNHNKGEEVIHKKDTEQISINCAGSQRGMFGGILVLVITIISLIMYFVLHNEPSYTVTAIKEVDIFEAITFFIMIIAIILAMFKLRHLRFSTKRNGAGISVDCLLLLVAQSGVFVYVMFSIIGCYFNMGKDMEGDYGIITEALSMIETCMQTTFIMNTWWRRIKGAQQIREKPGRQYVTFLMVANICLWIINTLIKSRAGFRPTHMDVFGNWTWTIITHLSMPLAIFYRYHSSICLYEIWKTVYKMKRYRNMNFKKHSIFSKSG